MLRPPIAEPRTKELLLLELKTRLGRVRKIKLRPGPKPANLLPLAPTTKWRVRRRITAKIRRVRKTTKNREPLRPNTLHARRTLLTLKLHVRRLPVQLPRRVRKANRNRNGKLGHRLNVHPARHVPSHIRRRHDHRLRLMRKLRLVRKSLKRLLAKKSLKRRNTNPKLS